MFQIYLMHYEFDKFVNIGVREETISPTAPKYSNTCNSFTMNYFEQDLSVLTVACYCTTVSHEADV